MIEYAETEGSDSTTHQTCIMQALHIKAILYADIKTIIKKTPPVLLFFSKKSHFAQMNLLTLSEACVPTSKYSWQKDF